MLYYLLFVGNKFQDGSIDTVSLCGWGLFISHGRKCLIFKDVSEVSVTGFAAHFCPCVAEMVIGIGDDIFSVSGIVEGRPTAVRIKLGIGVEELRVAARAVVSAGSLFFKLFVNIAIGAFGSGFTENAILLWREFFAPLSLRELNLFGRFFGRSGRGAHRFLGLFITIHEEEREKCSE